jgi:hypothetical protein
MQSMSTIQAIKHIERFSINRSFSFCRRTLWLLRACHSSQTAAMFVLAALLLFVVSQNLWATNNVISDQFLDGSGNSYFRPGGSIATLDDIGLGTVPIGPNPPVRVVPWGSLPTDNDVSAGISQMQAYGNKLYFGHTHTGRIWEYDLNGVRKTTPFLDVDALRPDFNTDGPTSGKGLRGFAFHPDFSNNGLLYTMHRESTTGGTATFDTAGGGSAIAHYVLGEWNFKSLVGGNPTFRSVMRVAYPATDHVASQINFNPTATPGNPDYGNLYIGFGDGGGSCSPSATCHNMFGYGQNMQAIQASLIRINPLGNNSANGQYGIPANNPFVGANDPTNTVLDEIYAKGFRNPTTMLFDRLTGALYSGDISHNSIEEVNLILPGRNYGWGTMEGTWIYTRLDNCISNCPVSNVQSNSMRYVPLGDGSDVTALSATYTGVDFNGNPVTYTNINRLNDGFTSPIAQFSHEKNQLDAANQSAAITGTVYRGVLAPALQGLFLYSSLSQDEIYYVRESDLVNDESPAQTQELRLVDQNGNPTSLWQIVGAPSTTQRVNHRFGQDANGDIYIISKHNDVIYRLEALTTPSVYGDTDLDSDVDQTDLSNFLAGWMKTAPVGQQSWMKGDFNQNGVTDLPDVFYMHRALVNVGLGNISPFGSVPEPTASILVLCGAICMCSGPRVPISD